jgi:hypothetical protein
MILERVFAHYRSNLKAALAFAVLLAFVPIFSLFESVFVGSGSMFLDYDMPWQVLFFLPPFLLFLVFYSLLVSIIVFSVRKDLSKLKLRFYLHEMIQRFAVKLFVFFAAFSLLLYAIVLVMLWLGVSVIFTGIFLLAVSLLLLFVPQAIVVDEEGLFHAVLNNLEFISKHPRGVFQVLVVGSALLSLVSLVGWLFDFLYLAGGYVSLFLATVFVLPFVEVMKTYLYMLRFDLIRSPQLVNNRQVKQASA